MAEDIIPVLPQRPSAETLRRSSKRVSEKQLRYAAWKATPEPYRRPATVNELADLLGVTRMTLYRWGLDPKVQHAMRWMVLNNAGDPLRVSRAIETLFDIGDDVTQPLKMRLQAYRQALDAVGIKESIKVDPELLKVEDVNEIDLSKLSDDELIEAYRDFAGVPDDEMAQIPVTFDTRDDDPQNS